MEDCILKLKCTFLCFDILQSYLTGSVGLQLNLKILNLTPCTMCFSWKIHHLHLNPEQLERILMHVESFLVIFTHREKELEWSVLSQVKVYSANFNLLEGRTEYKHIANDTCILLQVSKSIC